MGFFSKKQNQPKKTSDPFFTDTRGTITRWYTNGVAMGASHMFIVEGANLITDDPASDNQPVYLMAGQQLDMKKLGIKSSADIVDYYDLRLPLEPQLSRGIMKTAKLITDIQWNDWRPE
ncbi:MAG: hypothetical protein QOD75_3965 [Blastocatellia bacterium]|jgi:hypothetical protein|nr:hypothetical protein [Blastocatellia bacterium]